MENTYEKIKNTLYNACKKPNPSICVYYTTFMGRKTKFTYHNMRYGYDGYTKTFTIYGDRKNGLTDDCYKIIDIIKIIEICKK